MEEDAHKNNSLRRGEQERTEGFVEISIVQNINNKMMMMGKQLFNNNNIVVMVTKRAQVLQLPLLLQHQHPRSKIDLSFYEEHNESSDNLNEKPVDGETSPNVDITCMYIFADISIITELFNLVGRCPECNGKISFVVDFSKKKGQAQNVLITCGAGTDCSWTRATYLSETVDVGDHNRFDVNLRSIIAFREICSGLHQIEQFNRVTNLCPSYSHSNYNDNGERCIEWLCGYAERIPGWGDMQRINICSNAAPG